jgi:hypothetical protein
VFGGRWTAQVNTDLLGGGRQQPRRRVLMDRINRLIDIIGASEDEALSALLSAFTPPQPGVTSANWKSSSRFGNSAPTTKELWGILETADFRCSNCQSQLRITFDHADGDSTNHARTNLRVLCFTCNRAASRKATEDFAAGVRIYETAVALFEETTRFHLIKTLKRSGVKQSVA